MSRRSSLDHVLAVDIGTSSVRAMVFDAFGAVHGRVRIGYGTMRPELGFEEQDPDRVRADTYRAIALCLAEKGVTPGRIGAIAFSSQLYGVIALDSDEGPLTRNIVWSDARAEREAEDLKARFGPLGLYEKTGCPPSSLFPIAKIMWLGTHRPEIFGRVARYVSIKEYITAPLTGSWTVDHSMASGTGLFDIRARDWHAPALAAAGINLAQVSEPVSGTKPLALVSPGPFDGLGLDPNIRIFLGGGDGPLANLGSGASRHGAVNIDLGTSGAARCVVERPITDNAASLWCFCLADSTWAYGGILTNAGNTWDWLGALLASETAERDEAILRLGQAAANVVPGADGLHALPYLRKPRSPTWDARLTGVFWGLTPEHGRGHLGRALIEAMAYDLRTILGIMDVQVETEPAITLTGGLARMPLLPQILADVLCRPIRVPEEGEGSIAGAALLGAMGLGLVDTPAFLGEPAPLAEFAPNPENAARYRDLYGEHLRLVEVVRATTLSKEEEKQ
ncbi:MAG: gluconokinase [Alphaproteobacteria bacterium]|nr:gluconokinase [Alphaproteobacteria bacterium]